MKRKIYSLLIIAITCIVGIFFFWNYRTRKISYDCRWPVQYIHRTDDPLIEVGIQGNRYLLEIDLGSPVFLTLRNDYLPQIEKRFLKMGHSVDIHGNEYNLPVYAVEGVELDGVTIAKSELREESDRFLNEGSTIGMPIKSGDLRQGRIGRGLLTKYNLFLDFQKDVIFACSSLQNRIRDGYSVDHLIKVPFVMDKKHGILFDVRTQLGVFTFVLDTGANRSAIKSNVLYEALRKNGMQDSCPQSIFGVPKYHSPLFEIGGLDFGELDLLAIDMPTHFDGFDGIIGMDFFKKCVVYLDFNTKTALIGRSLVRVQGEAFS